MYSQEPMIESLVKQLILNVLPIQHFDLIITYHLQGEYKKHLRHEEVSNAVINLWYEAKITMDKLWVFAYKDGYKTHFLLPIENASLFNILSTDIWQRKCNIITKTYEFKP